MTVFNQETKQESAKLAAQLRQAGINTELHMEGKKLGKQFNYADKKGIPVVAIIAPDEIENGVVKFKRLRDGQEITSERAVSAESVKGILNPPL